MISFELFVIFVVVAIVGLVIDIRLLRRSINANRSQVLGAVQSVRRQIIVERNRLQARPTLRNRETMALGRKIDEEVAVNDGGIDRRNR